VNSAKLSAADYDTNQLKLSVCFKPKEGWVKDGISSFYLFILTVIDPMLHLARDPPPPAGL
jgi:hypothetical protein